MIEDMRIRNLAPNTQKWYIEHVAAFARYFGCSPDRLGPEQVRAYQLYLIQARKLSTSSVNVAVAALKFLPPQKNSWVNSGSGSSASV